MCIHWGIGRGDFSGFWVSGNPIGTSYQKFELRLTHNGRLFDWLNVVVSDLPVAVITLGSARGRSQPLTLHSTALVQ